MFDYPLPEVLPAGVGFRVVRRDGGRGGENVSCAEVRPKLFRDDRPAHEFGDGEEF